MKITDYRARFIKELCQIYDDAEAESFFYLILEEKKQLKRVDLAMQNDLFFSEEELLCWDFFLEELKQEKPVQYLLKKTTFCGYFFEITPDVLIPRPETEELVDWIIKSNKNTDSLRILDIGTGSGAIAISLAKNLPNASVFAIEVSQKALDVAKRNAVANNINITFIHKNIFEIENLGTSFDIIVSNPPYVRNLEKKEIRKNVLEYEPHLALFVEDDNPLIFYKKIIQLALKNLTTFGQLYFEINQYLGEEMRDLFLRNNYRDVELRKDIYNNYRMIFGRKP